MDVNSKVSFVKNMYQISRDTSSGFVDIEADFTGFPRTKIAQQTISGLNGFESDDLYNEFENYRANSNGPPVGGNNGGIYYSPNGNSYTGKPGKWLGQTIYSKYPVVDNADPTGDSP